MADLGSGIISQVASDGIINMTPVYQSVSGEKLLFRYEMVDKQLKVTPIVTPVLGKVASVLELPITNRFKAR